MGASIFAAIGGGLSEGFIGAAIAGSSKGVIYGTGAGYTAWGGVGVPTARGFSTRGDLAFPVGRSVTRDSTIPLTRARVSRLDQEIAFAEETQIFGPFVGPPKPLFQEKEMPVVVQGPPIPRPPVMPRPLPCW